MDLARNAYFKRLQQLSEADERIIFVGADCAGLIFEGYRKQHPNKFVNVGIAEQNMIAFSCGLALAGMLPFAYSHAPFGITRAFDQLRAGASMMKVPVCLIHSGIGAAMDGASHFRTNDFALANLIPGMRTVTPSTPRIAEILADWSLTHNSMPLYVRFDPDCDVELYAGRDIDFTRGFEVAAQGGDEVVIITSASYVHRVVALGLNAKVIDVFALPYDVKALAAIVGKSHILVIDEQVAHGSLGARMLFDFNEIGKHNPITVKGISLDGYVGESSSDSNYFKKRFGLTDAGIAAAVMSIKEKVNG
jgi:transketolase